MITAVASALSTGSHIERVVVPRGQPIELLSDRSTSASIVLCIGWHRVSWQRCGPLIHRMPASCFPDAVSRRWSLHQARDATLLSHNAVIRCEVNDAGFSAVVADAGLRLLWDPWKELQQTVELGGRVLEPAEQPSVARRTLFNILHDYAVGGGVFRG